MSRIERTNEKYSRAAARTDADRELDWETGRELERKDAEADKLRARIETLEADNDRLRAVLRAIMQLGGRNDLPDAWTLARAALGDQQRAVREKTDETK